MTDDKRPTSEEVAREIDGAEPSEALKRAVAADLEAHLPANRSPGQATQEPLVESQAEAEQESPGS